MVFRVSSYLQTSSQGRTLSSVYQSLMAVIQPGDTLVVKSLDRLGRSYAEMLEQWRIITKEKKALVVVLDACVII